jgi:lipoprotein NlpD
VTKFLRKPFWRVVGASVCLVSLLAGCASSPPSAPIEQRNVARPPGATTTTASGLPGGAGSPAGPASAPVAPVAAGTSPATAGVDPVKPPPPGIENAGKPGYFTVRPGDTLIRIALETGQNWRDLARWNNIDNPNLIEAGQVVRVVPPVGAAVAQPVAPSGRVEARPLDARGAATGASAPVAAGAPPAAVTAPAQVAAVNAPPAAAPSPSATPTPATPATPAAAPAAAAAGARDPDDELVWAWPATGSVLNAFDEARNKGVAIGGRAGDPVLAAADGRVVYAGSGLRGYGNLVIVKHNNTYLTAYAHNQVLLVKEDQVVRRGQKIAEMGSSDAERVQLHFEIRRLGKPVDPVRLLPAR